MKEQYSETIKRARFFQTVQAWPLSGKLNYDGWLRNFDEGRDRNIACMILDFFTYYPSHMIEAMVRTSVGRAGYILANKLARWKHSDFINRTIFSFIPGETQNPSDSGSVFIRIVRDSLGISEHNLVYYNDIHLRLKDARETKAVIFVDDFVGSGSQAYKAWNINKVGGNNITLRDIAKNEGHVFVYAPLIINQKGFELIENKCPLLNITSAHVLGPEYNLFNAECICWKNNKEFFEDGVELILRKSRELKIPSTDGIECFDEKGFGNQGLALSFEHGTPDSVPAIFYWKHENWTPLINKSYEL